MHLNLRARKRAAVIGGTSAALVVACVGTATAQAHPFGWWAAASHPFAVRADVGVAGKHSGGTVSGNVLSNDSDFGMDHLLGTDEAACEASGESDTTACAPVKDPTTGEYLVHQKTLDASGVVDDGEILKVDVSKLPSVLGTATVTLTY